jgi:hypothetical protein
MMLLGTVPFGPSVRLSTQTGLNSFAARALKRPASLASVRYIICGNNWGQSRITHSLIASPTVLSLGQAGCW